MPRSVRRSVITLIALVTIGRAPMLAQTNDVWNRVEHRYAENDGVRIHYVTLGKGPPIVMIHGFPDFWYLWRDYIEALSEDYQVVAVDLRGYNRSDKPQGVNPRESPDHWRMFSRSGARPSSGTTRTVWTISVSSATWCGVWKT